MHLTVLLFHLSVHYSKQANIMVQQYQKCNRGTYFDDVIYIALIYSQQSSYNGHFCHIAFLNILLFITVKMEKIISVVKDITHETHTTIFTNSRKHASGFIPGVFQCVYCEVFISFVR